MLRSSLTQMVVVMAVAFFMVLLTESVIQSSVSMGVQGESAAMREPSVLLGHLQSKPSLSDHSKRLASGVVHAEVLEEASKVTGIDLKEIQALALRCQSEQTYLQFFDEMGIGKRRILIKKNRGKDIFIYLSNLQTWNSFLEKLEPMRSLKLPTPEVELRSFLDGFHAFQSDMLRFSGLWEAKVDALGKAMAAHTKGSPLDEWIISAESGHLNAWREEVTEKGFFLEKEKLERIKELLILSITRDRIETKLRATEVVRQWRETFFKSAPLDEKMLQLTDPKVGELLGGSYSAEMRAEIVARIKYERKLRGLEKWVASNSELKSGSVIGGRKLFLALIAFLVCVVGITNAMLMSVTERFMEIATMKCLGATDGFILKQFVLEAGFQGLLGGVLGMLVGLIVACIKNFIQLGTPTLTYFPFSHVMVCSLTAIVCGIILAMLAAIYPSWSASRMAPMEAMRVE